MKKLGDLILFPLALLVFIAAVELFVWRKKGE